MILANIPLNIDWRQILLHLLNFVILIGALYFLLFGPIKKFIAKRKAYYEDLDKQALDKLSDATGKEELINNRLASLDDEIDAKKTKAMKELEVLRESETNRAKAEASQIISQANEQAKRDSKAILSQCDEEIKELVEEATKKVVLNSSCSEAFDQFLDAAEGSEENGN